jgi:hypothetical protein
MGCGRKQEGLPAALLQTAAVQPLQKHYVDAAGNFFKPQKPLRSRVLEQSLQP